MQKDSSPTIQGFKVRAVRVPMAEPHQTAIGTGVQWHEDAVSRFSA